MNRTATSTASTPSLRIEAAGTRAAARFVSDVIDLYVRSVFELSSDDQRVVLTRLAIVEAVTNIARHGYRETEPGPLTIELSRDGDWFIAVLEDRAIPFDVRGLAEIPRPEELRERGYGLGIIRHVMDEIEHEYSPETGNRTVLKKRIVD